MPYERSVGFAVLLPSTITLASPRKRGGGTADIIFWLAVQYSDSPTFTILKLFRAVTVGIVNASEAFMLALLSISIPFDPHQPFQNRTIPRHAPHLASLVKGEVLSPEKNSGDYRRDCFTPTNPSQTALSLENCQYTCHMNALFVLRPAKLRAFNFGHPCPFMNALLVSHPCETLGVQLRASMPVPCQR